MPRKTKTCGFADSHDIVWKKDGYYCSRCNLEMEPRMKEVCICAAVMLMSIEIGEGGKIWKGHRHQDAIRSMNEELSYEYNRSEILKMETMQGFITTKGIFVGRSSAYQLQIKAGIKSAAPGGYRGAELYSEDLY